MLGHLRAIKLAYESTAETVLIVEDDASPLLFPYWDMLLETFAEQLPRDWQAAQVGYLSLMEDRTVFGKFRGASEAPLQKEEVPYAVMVVPGNTKLTVGQQYFSSREDEGSRQGWFVTEMRDSHSAKSSLDIKVSPSMPPAAGEKAEDEPMPPASAVDEQPQTGPAFREGSAWGSGAYLLHRRGMEAIMGRFLKGGGRFDLRDMYRLCHPFSADDCLLGFDAGPGFNDHSQARWCNQNDTANGRRERVMLHTYMAVPPFITQSGSASLLGHESLDGSVCTDIASRLYLDRSCRRPSADAAGGPRFTMLHDKVEMCDPRSRGWSSCMT